MSAHIVASNPHPQYLLASNLTSAAKLQIKLNGLVDVNYTSAADGDILVHSGATWSLTNLNNIISGLTIYPATISTYGTVILATYPDISNNVSSTVITPNLISSYVSMVSTNIHREFSTAIDTSITNIPYATTTTSGRIRLATQAEANSSNFENADIVPAITPNVMRTYTSNYVSSYHGSYLQNMLSAGTGIYIDPSSVSTGSTVYNGIRVSDVPISEVVDLGTSLTTISTSLVNLDTSKQLKLAKDGTYTSVITSTINEGTDNETQVDTVHCTIPAAGENIPGIVSLVNTITSTNKNDTTTAVTPNALTGAIGAISGMFGFNSVIWRHVAPGLFTSNYIPNGTDAENTSGYYKLSNCRDDSLCLTIAWGRTELLQISGTCMYDIDIRPSGICKLQHVIAPILNVECYGGPEYYVLKTSAGAERVVANSKYRHGGVNYDVLRQTGGDSTQITADFNADAARKIYPIDISGNDNGKYPYMIENRIVITGRGRIAVAATSSTYFQVYEIDNMVPQYAAALHQYSNGSADANGLNPITHLRVIFNRINTDRPSTIFVHWCAIGLAPVSSDASVIWDGRDYNKNLANVLIESPDYIVERKVTFDGDHEDVGWHPGTSDVDDGIWEAGDDQNIPMVYGGSISHINLPVLCRHWYANKSCDHPRTEFVITYVLYRDLINESSYNFYQIENLAFVLSPANSIFYINFSKLRINISNGNLSIDNNNSTINYYTTVTNGGNNLTPGEKDTAATINNLTLNKFTYDPNIILNSSNHTPNDEIMQITDSEGVPCFNWRVAERSYWLHDPATAWDPDTNQNKTITNGLPVGTICNYEYYYGDHIRHRMQFIMGYTATRIIFKAVVGAYDRHNNHAGGRVICSDPTKITFNLIKR